MKNGKQLRTRGGGGSGGDESQPLPWGPRVALVLFVVAIVVFVVGRVSRAGSGLVGLAVATAVLGGVVLAGSLWQARRHRQVKVIADTVEGVIGQPVVGTRGARWRRGRLRRLVVEYPAHTRDTDPKLRERATSQLAARMGPVDCKWDTQKRTLTIARRPPVAPQDRKDPLPHPARIETVVELIFGSDARVKALEWEGERLTEFLVSYPPTTQDAVDQWRITANAVLAEKTGEWWLSQWEPEADQVTFAVRSALPTLVAHTDVSGLPDLPSPPLPPNAPVPPDGGGGGGWWGAPVDPPSPAPSTPETPTWPSPRPTSPPLPSPPLVPAPALVESSPAAMVPAAVVDVRAMPFASARSQILEWSPTGGAPHGLIIGSTGSGKTATIRTFIVQAALRGYHIFICDPKKTELWGFSVVGWPGVHEVATELDEMVLLVERIYQLMEVRYRRIKEEGPTVRRSLPPVLVVIDEAREWIDRIQASWKAAGGKGEHPTIERFRSLARLARTARIFLLVGIQRPDAAVFGGEARDNFRTRVACGELSQQGAQMLGLTGSGRVSENVPGRVMADVGAGWQEAQVIWTPDPSDDLSPEEQDIIERLRPTTVLPPLVLPPAFLPEPEAPASRSKKPKEEISSPLNVTGMGAGGAAETPGDGRPGPSGGRPGWPVESGPAVAGPVGPPVLRVLQGGGQPGGLSDGDEPGAAAAERWPGPAGWYVAGMQSALEAGSAHLAGRDGGCPEEDPAGLGWSEDGAGGWVPNGERIGWVDQGRGEVLLLPEVSMDAVGTHGELTAGALGRLLGAVGLLARVGEGNHVGVKIRAEGSRPRVWVLSRPVLAGVTPPQVVAPEPVEDLGPEVGAGAEPGPTGPTVAPGATGVAPPPVRPNNRFLDPFPPGVTRRGS